MEHVTQVAPRDDFHLELTFDTGERKVFDVKPYLDKGVFRRLQDIQLFKQAYVGGYRLLAARLGHCPRNPLRPLDPSLAKHGQQPMGVFDLNLNLAP